MSKVLLVPDAHSHLAPKPPSMIFIIVLEVLGIRGIFALCSALENQSSAIKTSAPIQTPPYADHLCQKDKPNLKGVGGM